MRLCEEEGCSRKHYAKGFCQRHYERHRYSTRSEVRRSIRDAQARYVERRGRDLWWPQHLRKTYGLSVEDYEALLERAGHACEICGEKPGRLCVDHQHDCGVVRGILCHRCNVALGLLDDNQERLVSAARYLADRSVVNL